MSRNSNLKRRREDPNQAKLSRFGIRLTGQKKLKSSSTLSQSVINKDVVKVLKKSIHDAQILLMNEGLQPPELQGKPSFRGLCQLLVDAAAQTKMNFDVDDFLLKPHQLIEVNKKEYRQIFDKKKPSIKLAARRKSLNFQIDLWDKHGVSMLGLNGSYWANHFEHPPWVYTNTAMGVHGFDELLTEPGAMEEVHKHTARKIRQATDELLGPNGWDILQDLKPYATFSGMPPTYTRDNGRNISSAFGEEGHIGTAHAMQTTVKWTEKEARRSTNNIVDRGLFCVERVAAKASSSTLNRTLELNNFNKIPSVSATR